MFLVRDRLFIRSCRDPNCRQAEGHLLPRNPFAGRGSLSGSRCALHAGGDVTTQLTKDNTTV